MDINKGINKKKDKKETNQNHIDEQQSHTFQKRDQPTFSIKSVMRWKKVIKHPQIGDERKKTTDSLNQKMGRNSRENTVYQQNDKVDKQ